MGEQQEQSSLEEVHIPSRDELLEAMDGVEESLDVEENAAPTEAVDGEEYNEVEQQALKMGWNPEGVEGKRTLSAEEFVDRQELYDEIKSLKNAVKNRDKDIKQISEQFKKLSENAKKQAIDELKAQKKDALLDDDVDRVIEIDEELAELRKEERQAAQATPDQELADAFEGWVAENEWYKTNTLLRGSADAIGGQLYQELNLPEGQAPTVEQMTKIYNEVAETLKEEFPDKFGITPAKKKRPSPVEGSTPKSNSKKAKSKYSKADLDSDTRRMMETIVRSGAMTESEYMDELVKANYFK